jgi:RimJ/RimL family protein N-acetyltransferase
MAMKDPIWTPDECFPREIVGGRVRLGIHELSDEHVRQAVELERANREDVSRWMAARNFENEEKARNFIISRTELFNRKMMADYAVYLKDTDVCIGLADFVNVGEMTGDVSYYIDRNYRNKGYATEAVGLLEGAFFGLGFKKMLLECNVENKPSIQVACKLGYNYDREEFFDMSNMIGFFKTAGR